MSRSHAMQPSDIRQEDVRERQWCLACGTVTRDNLCDCNRWPDGDEMKREPNFVNYADELHKQLRAALSAQTGEPVAWRWRHADSKHWIYDPSPEWREDFKDDPAVVFEPLYASPPPQPHTAPVAGERNALEHTRSCGYFDDEIGCTCCLEERKALATEQTMHQAWRKRAEEAEAALALAVTRGNYEDRHPKDEILWSASDHKDLIEVVEALGLQDSHQTPAEAVRELQAEIERLASPPPQPDTMPSPLSRVCDCVGPAEADPQPCRCEKSDDRFWQGYNAGLKAPRHAPGQPPSPLSTGEVDLKAVLRKHFYTGEPGDLDAIESAAIELSTGVAALSQPPATEQISERIKVPLPAGIDDTPSIRAKMQSSLLEATAKGVRNLAQGDEKSSTLDTARGATEQIRREVWQAALTDIVSWKHDVLGPPGDSVDPLQEAFRRGARMAFYRCADHASCALAATEQER